MTFIREASDVTVLQKAPDIPFEVTPELIQAEVDGFAVRVTPTVGEGCFVSVDLDGTPYCRCVYLPTKSPHFEEEDLTHEVTGFVSGLVWSAWRRRELARVAKSEAP